MIVMHRTQVLKGTKTHLRGWQDDAQFQVHESVEFDLRIKPKYWSEASLIVDLLSHKLLKNRFAEDRSDDQVIVHFFEKYKQQISQFIVKYMLQYGKTDEEQPERSDLGLPRTADAGTA